VGFNISRIKNWLGYENISNTDLNNEFNNIIQKAGADTLSSANSTNGSAPTVTAMQTTNNPGGVGSENLSTSAQQDVQQLRYVLNEIIGGEQWYSPPVASIAQLQSEISGSVLLPASRIISGRISSLSNNQPSFLVPDGTAATVYLRATSTNFSAYFNSVLENFTTDITTTGLSLAPGSNNTCTISDTTLSGAVATQQQGEYGSSISISSIGSNITSQAGNFAAFKHSTEYFIAQIENGTNTYASLTGNVGVSTTGTTSTSSNPTVIINVASTAGVYVGMSITGPGIIGSTTVVSFTSSTITISSSATASATSTFTLLGNQITGLSTISGISVGQTVSGTGVPSGTVVTAISTVPDEANGFSITLSAACTAVGSAATYTFVWFRLLNAFRGVGFDSNDNWLSRTSMSSGDTITLMKLTWVFATFNSGTPGISVTYNKPVTSFSQPSSSSVGDFWYNLNTNTWEIFNGTSYSPTDACFVGICIQDTTGCKAARSADFFKVFSTLNTLEPTCFDTTDIYVQSLSSKISVYGNQYYFQDSQPTWNTTANLDSGISLTTNTQYYCYVTDLGDFKISTVSPTARKFDLLGAYHPAKPWRCVAQFLTNGSSQVVVSSVLFTNFHQLVSPPQSIPGTSIVNNSITNKQIANNTISRYQLAPVGPVISGSSGSFSTTSTTFVPVTNLSINITTTGRPVMILLTSDGSSNVSNITGGNTAGTIGEIFISLLNGVIAIANYSLQSTVASNGAQSISISSPPGLVSFLLPLLAGTYQFSIQVKAASTCSAAVANCCLVAYEL
jgi:hypothetical protein